MPLFVQASAFNEECLTPLKLSLTTEWYPYVYKPESSPTTGVDVELLKILLAKMDCQLTIEHFPERRSLFELSWGHFDIALGASKTNEREQTFYFSNPYRVEKNRFAYRLQDKDITNAKSLKELIALKKTIAMNLAGWYGNELEAAKREYNGFIYSDTAPKRFKMLEYDRVDVVIDDDIVLCSEIKNTNLSNVAIHPLVLSQANIHFIFNKQSISQEFVKKFNDVLDEYRASGELGLMYKDLSSAACQR